MKFTLVHEDNRRSIHEVNSPELGFSIQKFHVKELLPLGNHFHRKKTETLVIDEGGGKVILCENGATSTLEISAGDVIHVEPLVGHCFLLEPNSRMTCFSSAAFDPNDKDMEPMKLA